MVAISAPNDQNTPSQISLSYSPEDLVMTRSTLPFGVTLLLFTLFLHPALADLNISWKKGFPKPGTEEGTIATAGTIKLEKGWLPGEVVIWVWEDGREVHIFSSLLSDQGNSEYSWSLQAKGLKGGINFNVLAMVVIKKVGQTETLASEPARVIPPAKKPE
jgi:hypothetical protein